MYKRILINNRLPKGGANTNKNFKAAAEPLACGGRQEKNEKSRFKENFSWIGRSVNHEYDAF